MTKDEALIQAYRLYTSVLEIRIADIEDTEEGRWQNRRARQAYGHLVTWLENLRDGRSTVDRVCRFAHDEHMTEARNAAGNPARAEMISIIYRAIYGIVDHISA